MQMSAWCTSTFRDLTACCPVCPVNLVNLSWSHRLFRLNFGQPFLSGWAFGDVSHRHVNQNLKVDSLFSHFIGSLTWKSRIIEMVFVPLRLDLFSNFQLSKYYYYFSSDSIMICLLSRYRLLGINNSFVILIRKWFDFHSKCQNQMINEKTGPFALITYYI